VVLQKDLSSKDYSGLMMDELEDLHMIRLRALEKYRKEQAASCQILQQESKSQAICRRGFGLESSTADWNQIQ
jgi:hypothetical protein